jgi:hypothetical protein
LPFAARPKKTGLGRFDQEASFCMRGSLRAYQAIKALPWTIRELINQHEAVAAQEIVAFGWIRSVRHQKRVVFADINDGSCSQDLQAIIKPDLAKEFVMEKA